MDWLGVIMASALVLLLMVPLAVLVGAMLFMAFVVPLLPTRPTVAQTSFDCPFSRRRVTAEFASWPGAERPADVLSCSAFSDPHAIRCKKECLALAHTGAVGSPMVPRFSLIAGGVAYRGTRSEEEAPAPPSDPDGQFVRAA